MWSELLVIRFMKEKLKKSDYVKPGERPRGAVTFPGLHEPVFHRKWIFPAFSIYRGSSHAALATSNRQITRDGVLKE